MKELVGALNKNDNKIEIGDARLRILLIEDSEGDTRLAHYSIHDDCIGQHRITDAVTLADGLRILATDGADIVLTDLGLPDACGRTVVQRIHDVAPHTPIVVLTGSKDPRVVEQVLKDGAEDYVEKDDLLGPQLDRAIKFALLRTRDRDRPANAAPPHNDGWEALRRELESARRMQMALLPQQAELQSYRDQLAIDICGYLEPCSTLGGDLWGALPIGDGRLAVFTFDFSGHGVGAALNTFRLHTLINAHRELAHAPAEMLERMDSLLARLLPKGQFATVFYGVIDMWDNSLTWSAAGAPTPFFIGADGRIETLDSAGLLLGIRSETHRREHRRFMGPGDGLVLYSDAVPESVDADGNFLGEDNVAALVVEAMAETGVHARLDRFIASFLARTAQPLQDDLTAVWLGRAAVS